MSSASLIEIKKYEFDTNLLSNFYNNKFVEGLWPLVYILSDGKVKQAYVGETADALSRLGNHLGNGEKNKLTSVHLITSDKFNKSATLDIESNLIKYMAGDGQYKLLNGNLGLANHSYYQKKEVYWDIFKTIWTQLKEEGITNKNLEQINNSDLFKYSPYKSLSSDQKASLIDILKTLLDKKSKNVIIEGGAGTGKTILAVFLFKLLQPGNEDFNYREFEGDEEELVKLVSELRNLYPNPKMVLVIPMSSFRKTIENVFKNIKGLSGKMVIGPAEVANSKYDILIVDESHRLRKRVNLGAYFGTFDIANKKLQLPKEAGNELDWILMQGNKNIFFYDENQSIKPSDVNKTDFDKLRGKDTTLTKTLISQFRVKGGKDYVSYIDKLLSCNFRKQESVFESKQYDFLLFNSLEKMIATIKNKDEEFGLSRSVAGFAWPWISQKNKELFDIVIGDVKLQWNNVAVDWVNSKNAANEIGCIHTTQGYDLNYTGIIFGNEIGYDKDKNEIFIRPEQYFDKNGKNTIKDPQQLKDYIINIYKTIMLRGIRGTYVYVCDEDLREYFREHIHVFEKRLPFTILPFHKVKPYVNSVPLYNIAAAAGEFSELQKDDDFEWIELPKPFKPSKGYFVCKVVGESMNKVIPNGSWCLFKKDPGGSRNGKIVLVEHTGMQDSDYGSGYTIKLYESNKEINEEGWTHQSIFLRPQSYDLNYETIVLAKDDLSLLKVVGIFVCVL